MTKVISPEERKKRGLYDERKGDKKVDGALDRFEKHQKQVIRLIVIAITSAITVVGLVGKLAFDVMEIYQKSGIHP